MSEQPSQLEQQPAAGKSAADTRAHTPSHSPTPTVNIFPPATKSKNLFKNKLMQQHRRREASIYNLSLSPSTSLLSEHESAFINESLTSQKHSQLQQSPFSNSNSNSNSNSTSTPASNPNPNPNPSSNPISNSPQPLNKLLKFTRRATKIAGDIAFGSAYSNDSFQHKPHQYYHTHPYHVPQLQSSQEKQAAAPTPATIQKQLDIEYHSKLKNLTKLAQEHSMEFYTDYLNFFLRYMDESEHKDPFIYAITRNSMWNSWYIKHLNKIRSSLNGAFDSTKEQLKPILSDNSNTSSQSIPNETDKLKIERFKKLIEDLPKIEQLDAEMFQDRKTVLLLLWHNQILKSLTYQNRILASLLSNYEKNSDICIITSNKLKPYKTIPNCALSKLLKHHTCPSQIELIDAWQIRHDFSDYRTNLVSITDRFQVILDLKHSGYLSPELLKDNPYFDNFIFLSNDFVHSKISSKISRFLSNYSSFISPSITHIPLHDNSQSVIFSPDFTRLVNSEQDVNAALADFNRILKPEGSIFLIIFDIKSSLPSNLNTSETPRDVQISEYTQLVINHELAKFSKLPYLSEMILPSLKAAKFTNINFLRLAIPAIDYRPESSSSSSFSSPNISINNSADSSNNMQAISDSPISSLLSMYSSYLDFIRVAHIVELEKWIQNPQDAPAFITPNLLAAFQLWLAWKIEGPTSELVKKTIISRLSLIEHTAGIDTELGVALVSRTGPFKVFDNDIEAWYDRAVEEHNFEDGDVLGTDLLLLVTAEKGTP